MLHEAIDRYQSRPSGDRDFALFGCVTGGGESIADVDEEQLLRGFGR